MPKTKKRIKEVEGASDLKLIYWIQDINREGGEQKYSEEFRKAVHEEICKRSDR